ncbi:MAG: hypothetical protein SFX73_28770 [Kofleriaceae bacterium]|nr:hypothetical protein [Kofleriaceae bacterium]
MSADPRREELLGWISQTRRTQRKLTYVIGAMILISSILLFWRLGIGPLALALTAIVGISGFWITSSHILDWNDRLAGLRRHAR